MEPKDFIHLLVKTRDIQRAHLEEYRRVTRESLELQRQEQIGRLYQRVVIVGALVLLSTVLFLVYLMGGFR